MGYNKRKAKFSRESQRRKRKQAATNPTRVKSVEQTSTNPTVTVNDNVTVNVNDKVINNIYSVYPSKCPVKGNSTNKCQKDKDKIKKLLFRISEDKLINTIEWYISDCKKSNTYIKNFGTFLNNLPDMAESKPSQETRKYTFECSFENRFKTELKTFDEQGAKDLYMRNNGIYPDKIIKL